MGSSTLSAASGSALAVAGGQILADPVFVSLITLAATIGTVVSTGIALGPVLNPPAPTN